MGGEDEDEDDEDEDEEEEERETLKARWNQWRLFEGQRIREDHRLVSNNTDNAFDTRAFVGICLQE